MLRQSIWILKILCGGIHSLSASLQCLLVIWTVCVPFYKAFWFFRLYTWPSRNFTSHQDYLFVCLDCLIWLFSLVRLSTWMFSLPVRLFKLSFLMPKLSACLYRIFVWQFGFLSVIWVDYPNAWTVHQDFGSLIWLSRQSIQMSTVLPDYQDVNLASKGGNNMRVFGSHSKIRV